VQQDKPAKLVILVLRDLLVTLDLLEQQVILVMLVKLVLQDLPVRQDLLEGVVIRAIQV